MPQPSPRHRSPSHPNAEPRRPFGQTTGRLVLLSGWTLACYRPGNSAPVFLDETSALTTLTRRRARVLPDRQRTTTPAVSHGMHVQNPVAHNAAVLSFLTSVG